jgi:hypothetical protein
VGIRELLDVEIVLHGSLGVTQKRPRAPTESRNSLRLSGLSVEMTTSRV